MFTKMLSFEFRYFTRQPSFIVTCLVFFLLPYLALVVDNVQIGSGGNVLFNSPFAITQILLILSIFSMFMVVNFMANTAIRNHDVSMAEIVYTKPIKPFAYSLGRFFGAFLVCILVFAMVPLGTFFGSIMPWIDAERIGSSDFNYYFVPFIIFSITTIFLLASVFYAAALRFNNMMAVYVVALGFFILYTIAGQVFDEPHQRIIRALSDPFGLNTYGDFTRYWTSFEKNNEVISLSGVVLQNRLIWMAIGVVALLFGGRLFKPLALAELKLKKVKETKKIKAPTTNNINVKPASSAGFMQFISRTKLEIKQVFLSPAFMFLLLFSGFQLVVSFFNINGMFGTPNWPLTQTMVNIIEGSFSLMIIVVITYYTAEVVWRERTVGIGDITDSMPVHNFTYWVSKLIAVILIIFALQAVGIFASVINQMIAGYGHIELGQYIVRLVYFVAIPFSLLAVFAFFIQTLSPNKYVGMLIFVGYIFVSLTFSNIGIEHNMFDFAAAPRLAYSDLNGYGAYLQTQNWYMLYWLAFTVVLGVISYGMWKRGINSSLKQRLPLLTYQVGGSGITVAILAIAVFIGSGYYINHNTRVLNKFIGSDAQLDLSADYEKELIEHQEDNAPVITSVDSNIDIFPEQRRIEAKAKIEIINKSDEVINRFLVNLPQNSESSNVTIEGGQLGEINSKLNIAWFEFDQALQPGEKRNGELSVVRVNNGFKDRDEDFTLVRNGTFIDNFTLFPFFGFNYQAKIQDRHERRKRELEPPQRAFPLEDSSHYTESFFGKGIGFIDFSATISTTGDQFAIAPGYLTREWQENGRNYYRYEMDAPMINFYNVMSAKLDTKKEVYKGVSIEVYYHPAHHWNVDRMIESVKDSMDYFQAAFGPYQHKQLRIIEFPGYRSFAQSFANTVPYSEAIGFVTDLRDPSDIDPVYYVTAHEMAHQWWGHQLASANVQGSAILAETLSQYSALMVMEKKYGEIKMRKFLTYELDRYLRGRSSELLEEMPLMRSENQQYIHYRKGSVIMMALKYKLGEQRLNTALANLLNEFKFRNDLYPTTLDLLRHLNEDASNDEQEYIDNIFTQITLYDLRATEVSSEELENGQYKVTLSVSAQQYSADGKGQETEQPFEEQVEVVLFSEDPNDYGADNRQIYNQHHKIKSGDSNIEIVVDEKPKYAGVDPFVRFIDRDTGNNVLKLN